MTQILKTYPLKTENILIRKNLRYNFAQPLTNFEHTLTKQSMAEECDINAIMKKYETTGMLPEMIEKNPQYGDFSEPIDYMMSMNLVIHAQEQFEALPATVRERFQNQPEKFLEFTANPENQDELIRMGLATKKPDPIPDIKTEPKTPSSNKKAPHSKSDASSDE